MKKRYVPLAFVALAVVGAAAQEPRPASPPSGTGLITGRVVDADSGSPVASALIVLTARMEGMQFGPGLRVLTDSDGKFFFRNLAPGTFLVTASKAGWLGSGFGQRRPNSGPRTFDLADGARRANIDVTMWKYAVISGRVTDDRGDPIVGVNVRAAQIMYLAGRPQAAIAGRAITDDLGSYRFPNLQPGNYYIAVPATVTSEPATFDGAIRSAGSMPHSYYQTMTTIGAAPTLSVERTSASARTDQSLLSVAPGMSGLPPVNGQWMTYPTTFFPSALTTGAATVVQAQTGRDRTETNIVMRAVPTFRVSGEILDADGPAKFNAVHLINADAADAPLFDMATAIADAAGRFTMYGVPSGQYVARVVRIPWPAEGQLGLIGGTGAIPYIDQYSSTRPSGPPKVSSEPLMSTSVQVNVSDRDIANLQLTLRPGAHIEGRVEFDGAADRPTTAQMQTLRVPLELANGQTSFLLGQGIFNDQGKFTTPSLWPGRYLIRMPAPSGWTFKSATYQGRDVSAVPLELTDGMVASDVVITFTDHPTKIQGTVQSTDTQPIAGSIVTLFPTDPKGWTDYGRSPRTIQGARVSEAGTFSMPAPPAGQYLIVAIPEADAADLQNPAVLQKLAPLAEQVRVVDGSFVTLSLTIKRVPR